MNRNNARALLAPVLVCLASAAAAAPRQDQAEKFLQDFNGVVSQAALRLDTVQARKEQLARIEELERRSERLFGGAADPTFGPCVGAVIMLKSTWSTQMQLVAGAGKPHQVASLASESIQVGEKRQQCAIAVDEIKPSKPKP